MGDNSMFVFARVFLSGCLCFVSMKSARTGEFENVVGKAKAVQSEVLRILNNEAIWNDQTQNEALAEVVELATRLPSKEYLPPLLRHVTRKFGPDPRMQLSSFRTLWPVGGAVAAIGPVAVPDVIERIKQIPCDASDEQAEEVRVLLGCMCEIYGTHACYEIARRRIRCEVDREHGEAVTRLKCAAEPLQPDNDSE